MRTGYRKFSSDSAMWNYIDILMTLIFFLMLTGSDDVYRFAAQLPGSEPSPLVGLQTQPEAVTIFISEKGTFHLDGDGLRGAVTLQELERSLAQLFRQSQDRMLVRIGGDRRSTNEDITTVLSICSGLGIQKIEFLSSPL